MIKAWEDKKILILGFGREGLSSLEFLRQKFHDKEIGVADQLKFRDLNYKLKEKIKKFSPLKLHLGKDYLKAIDKYNIIIRSPGLSMASPALIRAKEKGKIISSQTKIFFDLCPGIIIGVTGTKGKSTTSSLIFAILKAARKKVKLIGNIGKPALTFLNGNGKDTIFIFELSSHQLVDLKKSPHTAVLLNIVPEHLDYYKNFKEYLNAKKSFILYQDKDDYLIYNASFPVTRKLSKISKAKKIPFYIDRQKCPGCFPDGGKLVYCYSQSGKEEIIKIKDIPLRGKFNLQNVMPAIIVAKIFNLDNQTIARAIKKFKPLPHRLELVGIFKGITFYNDSLATNPNATIAAIDTFKNKIGTIFLGGHERNLDFSALAKQILLYKIKNIILFPVNGKRIWQEIQKRAGTFSPQHFFAKNMKEAVKLAYQHTPQGKICLLSCAAPSFGLFKDYKDRGDQFKKWVKKLRS